MDTPTGVDRPLEQIIQEAIGAASVCWETPEGAGVFDSDRAKRIADDLLAVVIERLRAEQKESYRAGWRACREYARKAFALLVTGEKADALVGSGDVDEGLPEEPPLEGVHVPTPIVG